MVLSGGVSETTFPVGVSETTVSAGLSGMNFTTSVSIVAVSEGKLFSAVSVYIYLTVSLGIWVFIISLLMTV